MNHTLDQFTDNPIIDEIVCWPPREQAIFSIRASAPMFRKPFIEVTLVNGEIFIRHFAKQAFVSHWREAQVILQTLTSIKLISELKNAEHPDRDQFAAEVLAEREQSIAEACLMFNHGMYQQYLWQFGVDYSHLPPQIEAQLAQARAAMNGVNE